MVVLSNSFLKVVKQKVNDCSNPTQLRAYLNQYQSYVMSEEIKNVFYARIEFFKEYYSHDSLFMAQCEDLEDDLEINIQIASICKTTLIRFDDNMKKIVRSQYDGHSQEEYEFLLNTIKECEGNERKMMDLLKVSNTQLLKKLSHYNLKGTLIKVRKENSKNKPKPIYTEF